MTQSLPTATAACTIVSDGQTVQVPFWVVDLEAFRRWYRSPEFPEDGRICYLAGKVWVDMSREQVFWHNQVKTEFSRVLANLAREEKSGRYFTDGVRLTNVEADLSCVPDGPYVSNKTFSGGRIRLVDGAEAGHVELEGTPDLVLEVLSPSSEEKDSEVLPDLYWRAGITEYWHVDARGDRLQFDILRHGNNGWTTTRKQGGWLRSKVLGRSFMLSRQDDALGHPEYMLDVRG